MIFCLILKIILDTCLKSAFTTPTDQYDSECLKAATDVFELGKRRFPRCKKFCNLEALQNTRMGTEIQIKKSLQAYTQTMSILEVTR